MEGGALGSPGSAQFWASTWKEKKQWSRAVLEHQRNASAGSQPYAVDPGVVGGDAGEDGGFVLDVAAQRGHEAGDAVDLVLPVHLAVERTARVTLRDRGTK